MMGDLINRRFVADMEEIPNGAAIGVDITDLRKEWSLSNLGGVKVAVDSLNLQFLKNNVNVLLGQNGAGKTTTLSIVTGLFAPTSGSVSINGHDIVTDTANARKSIGLCPQFDILWDALTVEEHMYFFARLKGVQDSQQIKEESERMLVSVRLPWTGFLSAYLTKFPSAFRKLYHAIRNMFFERCSTLLF